MWVRSISTSLLVFNLAACGAASERPAPAMGDAGSEAPRASAPAPIDSEREKQAIAALLDDWHGAAASADEERYFAHFTPDAVFLGTDATERWDLGAFRAFAHPFFARGKAWSFRAVRRAVILGPGALIAWFDEDLDTPNMGPARGSGVLVRERLGAPFRIAHYNLALTIPNDRMDEVKALLAGAGAKKP
jgi:uncharacterized protein (TIGR02246 family)